MKITVPLAYQMRVRPTRNPNAFPTPIYAWQPVEIEVPDYSSDDIHLVAEWRQEFGKLALGAPSKRSAARWDQALDEDPNLVRLVLIDGRFHVPLRSLHRNENPTLSVVRASDFNHGLRTSGKAYALGDEAYSTFEQQLDLLRRTDYSRHSTVEEGRPDLHGKSVVQDDFILQRDNFAKVTEQFAFVDGVLFVEVSEPVLILARRTDEDKDVDQVRLKVGVAKDYAWPSVEMYFPLTQFDDAVSTLEEHWAAENRGLAVTDVRIFSHQALSSTLERDEADRSIRHYLRETGAILPLMELDQATSWFHMRDQVRVQEDEALTDDQRDRLSEGVVELSCQIQDITELNAHQRNIVRFGKILANRWQMRNFDDENGPTI
jgi:hypothetical protein